MSSAADLGARAGLHTGTGGSASDGEIVGGGTILEVTNLGKRFGDRWIFRGLSFTVSPGQILAILGRNGSGKSTLLNLLAGLIRPTEGDVATQPGVIGYAALAGELYPSLTVAEHLELCADFRGCEPRVEELLDQVRLGYAAKYLAGTLSTGMGTRLKLAMAVQARPQLLILDEPSAGLDEEGREVVQAMLAHQLVTGAAILATNEGRERALATHELELN